MTGRRRITAVLPWVFPTLTLSMTCAALVLTPADGAGIAQTSAGAAVAMGFSLTGAVIAFRRPRNGIGWLFCIFGLGIPTEEVVEARLAAAGDLGSVELWIAWVSFWLWAPSLAAMVTYLPLTFPHGRIVGRAARVILSLAGGGVTMVVVGTALASDIFDGMQRNPVAVAGHDELLDGLTEWGLVPVAIAVAASTTALVRRYRRSTGALRQQFKWFVFAMSCAVAAAVANGVLYEVGNEAAGQIAFASGFVWLPVALGVAIFRYRLYDIDRIISRTVSWGLVTVVIGGVYLGLVTVLTSLTARVAGDSAFAVAGSTLAAAAAFGPVRRRIQSGVDRHFYRSRYDAERTVSVYRARLRDEVNITALQSELLRTVDATVQPAAAVLWLPSDAGAKS